MARKKSSSLPKKLLPIAAAFLVLVALGFVFLGSKDQSTHRTVPALDVAAYLEAALQDGDPQLVAAALGDIARAKGMSQIARDAGLGRESLYKSLSSSGNPELATVLKVISALGLQLHVSAIDEAKVAV